MQQVPQPLPTATGPDVRLDRITEQQQAHTIIVLSSRQAHERRYFCREILLRAPAGTEIGRSRHVHHKEDVQLPLFYKPLDEWSAGTGSDFPVDRVERVSGCVLTDLGKLDTVSSKDCLVRSKCPILHEPPGPNLKAANQLGDLLSSRWGGWTTAPRQGESHQGMGTTPRRRSITWSGVTSSASASNVIKTRCRRTSRARSLTSSGITYGLPSMNACARAARPR